jgi:hypothetical protein
MQLAKRLNFKILTIPSGGEELELLLVESKVRQPLWKTAGGVLKSYMNISCLILKSHALRCLREMKT